MADQKREEDVEELNPDQQPEDDDEELIIDHPNPNPKVTDRDREVANKISDLMINATEEFKRKLEAEGPGPSGEPRVKSVEEKKAEVSGESSAMSKAIVAIDANSPMSFKTASQKLFKNLRTSLATLLAAQNLAKPVDAYVMTNEKITKFIKQAIQKLMHKHANSSTTETPSSQVAVNKETPGLDQDWKNLIYIGIAGGLCIILILVSYACKVCSRYIGINKEIVAEDIFSEAIPDLPKIEVIPATSSESSDGVSVELTTGQEGLLQIQALVMDHLEIPGQYRPRSRSVHTPAGSTPAKKLKPSPSAPGELNEMAGQSSSQRSSSPRTSAARPRGRPQRHYIDLTRSQSIVGDVHNVVRGTFTDETFEMKYGIRRMTRSHSHYL